MIKFTREVQLMKLLHSAYVKQDVNRFISLLEKIGWEKSEENNEDGWVRLGSFFAPIWIRFKSFRISSLERLELKNLDQRSWWYLFFVRRLIYEELKRELHTTGLALQGWVPLIEIDYQYRILEFGIKDKTNRKNYLRFIIVSYDEFLRERTQDKTKELPYKEFIYLNKVADRIDQFIEEVKDG